MAEQKKKLRKFSEMKNYVPGAPHMPDTLVTFHKKTPRGLRKSK